MHGGFEREKVLSLRFRLPIPCDVFSGKDTFLDVLCHVMMIGKKKDMFKSRNVITILFISSCVILTCTFVKADGPRAFFNGLFGSANKVSADPKADYPLDETNGPWMIYVKNYDGPNAREDARTLALELRQKHGFKAYVYHKQFDLAQMLEEEENHKQLEMEFRMALQQSGIEDMPFHNPIRTKFVNGNMTDEYAVLVGDFQSIDDKDINKAYEKIINLEPVCIIAQLKRDIAQAEQTGTDFSKTTMIDLQRFDYREQNNIAVRPLAKAMKITNPILPPEFFSNRVDDFVQKLNAESRYSLLRCPGKYTIKVGEYRGFVIADPKGIQEAEKNESVLHQTNQLANAGENAEQVCEALRLKGYEAYTFHDRTKSIVTVGSFNSLGKTDRNGYVTEFLPEITGIIKTFAWDSEVDKTVHRPSADEPFRLGKSILNIPLLPIPEPMDVPKPFINYNRR